MRYLTLLFSLICLASTSSTALAADWLTLPSTYTHGQDGNRVAQYARIQAPSVPVPASFRTSGYTHTRSTLNYGQSQDNYHRVEEWGDPVRPYGEWRFPFRPYSTPYPNWGPPFAGLQQGFGAGFGRGGFGNGGFGRPGFDPGYGPGDGHKPGPGDGKPGPGKTKQPIPRFRGETGYLGGGRWPSDRNRDFRNHSGNRGQGSLNPYPAGGGSPYPVAPYYDGYYPPYHQ